MMRLPPFMNPGFPGVSSPFPGSGQQPMPFGMPGFPGKPGMPQMPMQPPQPGTFNPMPFEGGLGGFGGFKPTPQAGLGMGFGRGHFGPPAGMPMKGSPRRRAY